MKDEHDKKTVSLVGISEVSPAAPQGTEAAAGLPPKRKFKFKFLPKKYGHTPEGTKPADPDNLYWPMFGRSVVPVSSVARDWGISARRVRVMLAEGRLEGRQLDNGYWEVFYPYRYVMGTRGPATTRQKNTPPRPKKAERMQEW